MPALYEALAPQSIEIEPPPTSSTGNVTGSDGVRVTQLGPPRRQS